MRENAHGMGCGVYAAGAAAMHDRPMDSSIGFVVGAAWVLALAFNAWWLWRTTRFMGRVETSLSALEQLARDAGDERDRKRR